MMPLIGEKPGEAVERLEALIDEYRLETSAMILDALRAGRTREQIALVWERDTKAFTDHVGQVQLGDDGWCWIVARNNALAMLDDFTVKWFLELNDRVLIVVLEDGTAWPWPALICDGCTKPGEAS